MKRFAEMGLASICCWALITAVAVSCNWMPEMEEEEIGEGFLRLNFSSNNATKSEILNTDNFWLKIVSSEDELVYSGRFGDRPEQIRVRAGSYTVRAVSDTMPMPAFDKPVYGDSKSVTVQNEEVSQVHLECRMVNCGLKLTYSDNFIERYQNCAPALQSASGNLEYPYSKSGLETAYFDSGKVYFTLDGEYLFSKDLVAGEIRHIQVDATSDMGDMGFTITLDQTQVVVADSIKIEGITPLTVAASKMMPTGIKVTVRGIVVGVINSNKLVDSAAVKSNIVIADSENGPHSIETVLPVELKKSTDQDALSYETTKGKWIVVTGTVGTMYKTTALTGISGYTLE